MLCYGKYQDFIGILLRWKLSGGNLCTVHILDLVS